MHWEINFHQNGQLSPRADCGTSENPKGAFLMFFFSSFRCSYSVLLQAGINYFNYSTHNKDYSIVYFEYPLNMSTLVMATLFSVIETHKCHIFLI